MEDYQWGGGRRRKEEKVQESRSTICRYKIDRGGVKNSVRNGEAKELICTTHRHELKRGIAAGKGSTG